MTILAVAGLKGAPGATTLALALTAIAAESRSAAMIELDPAGGDIAAALGLPTEPGLVSLAAASRHGVAAELVVHAVALPCGGVAVLAPPDTLMARTAAASVAPTVAALAQQVDVLVVDVGRLTPAAASLDADVLVLAARPDAAGVAHLRSHLALAPDVVVVLLGSEPYNAAEVQAATDARAVLTVPVDARGVAALHGRTRRGGNRLPLLRAVRSFAPALMSEAVVSA